MTTPAIQLERHERAGNWWRIFLRLAVPAVILGLLWNFADGPGALALLEHLDWTFIALAFLAVNLQTLVSAWRWHVVATRLGLVIPLPRAIAEYYLSQLVNQSLPGGVLGDAARAMRARHGAGLRIAAHAVIIERMAGQIAMFSLLFLGIVWALIAPGGIDLGIDLAYLAPVLFACGVAALVIYIALKKFRMHWTDSFGRAAKQALLADRAWIGQSLFGAAIVALNVSSFALCALATGTALSLEAILVVVPLILCAMLVPATVAGWGFREGAAAALFPVVGASAAAGFAASLAFGVVILAASLPGLVVLMSQKQRRTDIEKWRQP